MFGVEIFIVTYLNKFNEKGNRKRRKEIDRKYFVEEIKLELFIRIICRVRGKMIS